MSAINPELSLNLRMGLIKETGLTDVKELQKLYYWIITDVNKPSIIKATGLVPNA
jgi:hypothetical protein